MVTSSFYCEIRNSVLRKITCESWNDIWTLKLKLVINLKTDNNLGPYHTVQLAEFNSIAFDFGNYQFQMLDKSQVF